MSIGDIFVIGVGLSMDAAVTALSNGMAFGTVAAGRLKRWAAPFLFGLFQALMPLFGFFAGGLFADFVSSFSHLLVCAILSAIGVKMLWDGIFSKEGECPVPGGFLTWRLLLLQAVATSIDAFAVGVGFRAVGIPPILLSVSLIGVTTFVLSGICLGFGRFCGTRMGKWALLLGGALLVGIGIKALF